MTGRPAKATSYPNGKYVGCRMEPAVYDGIKIASEENHRSMSMEMRWRLEQSFRDDLIMQRLDRLEAAIKALGALLNIRETA